MRACIFAAVFALCCVAQARAQAQAERRTFCPESVPHTCVDIAIETQPSAAGGTDVSIRIADVQLESTRDAGNHLPWYRLHRVDLVAADAAFQGGDISSAPIATLVGAARAIGNVALNWPAGTFSRPDRWVGYSIRTDRPNEGVAGRGEILLRFTTAGLWQAEQMKLVLALHGDYAGDASCTPTDIPAARAAHAANRCERGDRRALTKQPSRAPLGRPARVAG